MSLNDIVRCEKCRRTCRKADTLIVGGHRLCRDCQVKHFINEVKGQGLDVKLKVMDFANSIKEGKDGRG